MARRGHMGRISSETKRARRAAHKAEWARRPHEPWEEWNERTPNARAQERLRLVEQLRKEGKQKPRVHHQKGERPRGKLVDAEKLTQYRRRVARRKYMTQIAREEHRGRSAKKFGMHLTARCKHACHDHTATYLKLLDKAEDFRRHEQSDLEQKYLDRAEHAFELYERCERRCFDSMLGRGYRGERGWEATGKRHTARAAEAEQRKYERLLAERASLTPEQRRRRIWEADMAEYAGPAFLDEPETERIHPSRRMPPVRIKAGTQEQRQRAVKAFRKKCKRLPKSEQAACLRMVGKD